MSAQVNEEEVDRTAEETNEVLLRGRLSGAPEERVLPSGDTVWTFRVVIGRQPREPSAGQRRPGVDALECAVWSGRVKRSVPSWRDGDVVEVGGALRRRFFKSAGATVSRVEVDVARGKVIRRAATG
jgi:single-strand DNA-binding protein